MREFVCAHGYLSVQACATGGKLTWSLTQASLLVPLVTSVHAPVYTHGFTILVAAFTAGSLVLYGKTMNASINNGAGQVKIAFGIATVSLIYS